MILNSEEASTRAESLRTSGNIVGLSQGIFDMLHAGHIEHFLLCKQHCDVLFVSLTPDKFAAKGPGRPLYVQRSRAAIIDCLNMVDFVVCDDSDDESACSVLNYIKPNFYFKGTEYRDKVDLTRNIGREVETVRKHGGDVKYLSGEIMSSTDLINKAVSTDEFRQHIDSPARYVDLLDKMGKLRTCVIGEGITDEYISVISLGGANKYPILSTEETSRRRDDGGAKAVYNLLYDFCGMVTLVSHKGDCEFLDRDVIKTRYVDSQKNHKLFEVSQKIQVNADAELVAEFLKMYSLDVLLLLDFGHGAFTKEVIDALHLSKASKYLMVQHNSANRYVNFPWKYAGIHKKALCMNEKESIVNSGQTNVQKAARELRAKTDSDYLLITQGQAGAMCYDGEVFCQIPAVGSTIKDTIGCGDVFFAISSLALEAGGSPKEAILMANIFAYLHAQIDGNSGVVTKNDFVRFARGLA